MEKYVVTISRQFGSLGRSIAQRMSNLLEVNFYDRDIVEATAKRMGLPISVISQKEENSNSRFFSRQYPLGMGLISMQNEIFQIQENIIRDIAEKESCIIVGRCANYVLRDDPNCLNIYIYAPMEARYKNCVETLAMEPKAARRMIHDVDKARENYRRRYGGQVDGPCDGYHLLIDSSRFGVEMTAVILSELVKKQLIQKK